jgi:predicted DNA-binding protein (MmcQ/YjbR family)
VKKAIRVISVILLKFVTKKPGIKNNTMVSIDAFRTMALSFPGAEEAPHFEKTSFRINKKIFATLNVPENRICIKLSAIDQSVFCLYDKTVIYPVPNKWGSQGWTLVNLGKIKKIMLKDALTSAYNEVATKVKPSKKR